MNRLKCLSIFSGACLILAAPLQAQFAGFNPDSVADFYVVAGSGNSTENTGVGVSGQFQWDSDQLFLRVIITNLVGSDGFSGPDNGVMTGFGFQTPPLLADSVTLDHQGIYDVDTNTATANQANLNFNAIQPVAFSPGSLFPVLGAGATTPPEENPNAGTTGDGVLENTTAYFDFNFVNAGIAGADFSFEGFGYADAEDFTIAFRFQGVGQGDDTEGSDRFGGGFTPIPEPSTYGMFGILALLGLISLRSMRGKRK